MKTFEKLWYANTEKDRILPKTFKIDDKMYMRLKDLSQTQYQGVSVNRMVTAAIEKLVSSNRDIRLHPFSNCCGRTYLIRESLYEELKALGKKYNISVFKLVNIAVYEALEEEES